MSTTAEPIHDLEPAGQGGGASLPPGGPEIIEPDHEPYSHAAGDKLRVGIALITFLATLLVAAVFHSLIEGASNDLQGIAGRVPSELTKFLIGLDGTIAFVSSLGLLATLVVLRRLRVTIMVALSVAASYFLLDVLSLALQNGFALPGSVGTVRFAAANGPHFLAMGAAVVTVLGPWFPRPVRRLGIATVAFIAFTRTQLQTDIANKPYDVVMAIMLGWLIGAVVVMLFGSPNRHPSGRNVAEALDRAGLSLRRLEMVGRGLRGSTIYVADRTDGTRQFVKVFSTDQRDADLLLQFFRWIRLRDATDERPFSTLRRAVEHEALISLKAADDGIPTARMMAVAEVEPDGMLLAFDYLGGESLEGAGKYIADSMLDEVWTVARGCRERHIAHRDLRMAHMIVGADGHPRVVDFGYGELAAPPALLRTDFAELLVSMACEVGAERAVRSAVRVMGVDALGDMVSRLQPLALTRETRTQLGRQDGLLDELRSLAQQTAGLEDVRYEELARVKPRTIGIVVVFSVALYLLVPQVSAVNDIGERIASANFWWTIPMIGFVVVCWTGATIGVMGSVPDRLPFLPMFSAQVSSSFLDTLAPAGLGGMALNTRIMQKRGVEPAVAVAGVGLNGVAGFVMHILLLGVFLLWSAATGSQTAETRAAISAPDTRTIVVGVVGVGVLIAIALILPYTRRLVREKGIPMVKDAGRGLAELARKPRKLLALFGGSAIITLGFYGALLCAVQAFGGGISPAQIGAAYMVAFAVSVLAPTPGAVGALELSLSTAFIQLGLPSGTAYGAVGLFRLMTFFLPIIPGWITFTIIQRRGIA